MSNHRNLSLLVATILYLLLWFTPGLRLIAFPIEILCTFLHEFGHATFSIISGGHVHSLCVNMDGSGVTTMSGGSPGLETMGGYVGSAIFGNLMIRLSYKNASSIILKILSVCMLVAALFWFSNLITTIALLVFSVALFIMSRAKFSSFILSFLGVACVIYIIQDFNVGPTSDLQAYEREIGFFSAKIWMYIWLAIVILLTGINVLYLQKKANARQ